MSTARERISNRMRQIVHDEGKNAVPATRQDMQNLERTVILAAEAIIEALWEARP